MFVLLMLVLNEYTHAESINKVAQLNDELGCEIKNVKEYTFANKADQNSTRTIIEPFRDKLKF